MTQYTSDVAKKAIETYGEDFQLERVIEECAELIEALVKLKRKRCTPQDVISEIADVYVTLESARHIFKSHLIDHEIVVKTSKLDMQLKRQWKQNYKEMGEKLACLFI